MKILLDECIPRRLKSAFVEHNCMTVPEAGFAGKKNGVLLSLAEDADFDVFLTLDKASNISRIWRAGVSLFSFSAPDRTGLQICCRTWKRAGKSWAQSSLAKSCG